jgi:hypothetical protein
MEIAPSASQNTLKKKLSKREATRGVKSHSLFPKWAPQLTEPSQQYASYPPRLPVYTEKSAAFQKSEGLNPKDKEMFLRVVSGKPLPGDKPLEVLQKRMLDNLGIKYTGGPEKSAAFQLGASSTYVSNVMPPDAVFIKVANKLKISPVMVKDAYIKKKAIGPKAIAALGVGAGLLAPNIMRGLSQLFGGSINAPNVRMDPKMRELQNLHNYNSYVKQLAQAQQDAWNPQASSPFKSASIKKSANQGLLKAVLVKSAIDWGEFAAGAGSGAGVGAGLGSIIPGLGTGIGALVGGGLGGLSSLLWGKGGYGSPQTNINAPNVKMDPRMKQIQDLHNYNSYVRQMALAQQDAWNPSVRSPFAPSPQMGYSQMGY